MHVLQAIIIYSFILLSGLYCRHNVYKRRGRFEITICCGRLIVNVLYTIYMSPIR